MPRVLVIEDEELLRDSVVEGLGALPAVNVEGVSTLRGALRSIDRSRPDLILSDINLPDRSGIELLGELEQRGVATPVVFMTAFLRNYRSHLPKNMEILEKPVRIESLRRLVVSHLEQPPVEPAPFVASDYLQLACMGRHSVLIEVHASGIILGQILVHRGTLWTASDAEGAGREAFARLVTAEGATATCVTHRGEPGAQTLTGSYEALLLDSARIADEVRAGRRATGSHAAVVVDPREAQRREPHMRDPAPQPQTAPTPSPPPPPVIGPGIEGMSFDDAFDLGIDALLSRDWSTTVRAFRRAEALRPDDERVRANLERLRALGRLDTP